MSFEMAPGSMFVKFPNRSAKDIEDLIKSMKFLFLVGDISFLLGRIASINTNVINAPIRFAILYSAPSISSPSLLNQLNLIGSIGISLHYS